MSELIEEVEAAKRQYNKALNHLAAVINKHADRVQKLRDKRDADIRYVIDAEYVKMFGSLQILPRGPKFVADRDARVWIAAQKQAFKEALAIVKTNAPKAKVAINELHLLFKKGK